MFDPSQKAILNINDNSAIRYVLSRILRSGGFQVFEAENGADGIQLSHNLPDLILLDVQLPDIHGYEVCKAIKADNRTAHLPIVMISAVMVKAEDIEGGISSGADRYLTHPVPVRDLLETVTQLIAR